MAKKKNQINIKWEVGIDGETADIYVSFQSADKRFRCTMDASTAQGMGSALIDAANKRINEGIKETPIQ